MFDPDLVEENLPIHEYIYSLLYNKTNLVLTSVYGISVDKLYLCVTDYISSCNSELFSFDNFQLKIFKVFLAIFLINVVFIIFLWHLYKDLIYERFMQPASSCIIEELRKSVSQLKLPRGHSPRI